MTQTTKDKRAQTVPKRGTVWHNVLCIKGGMPVIIHRGGMGLGTYTSLRRSVPKQIGPSPQHYLRPPRAQPRPRPRQLSVMSTPPPTIFHTPILRMPMKAMRTHCQPKCLPSSSVIFNSEIKAREATPAISTRARIDMYFMIVQHSLSIQRSDR
jgi:hypothetical protein